MDHLFVDPDIRVAKTLHTDFYTSQALFEQSRENIFAKSWHFLADEDAIGDSGSCYPVLLLPDFLDEPLVLTRDLTGNLHCLSNVCTHRGNLLVTEPGKHKHIRCRYHGRLFDLNGSYRSMPEFKEVKNFPTTDDNLTQLKLFRWAKWLFSSVSNRYDAHPFFGDMIKRIEWMPLHNFQFRPDLSRDYHVNAHWALYCENYLEGFHIPFVHNDLNSVIDYSNYTTELFGLSNLQLGIARRGEHCFDLPQHSADYGKNVAAYYFWVFPNMMFNFYPWGLSINIVQPKTVNETCVSFLNYMWDESKYNRGAGAELDKVEHEDEEVVMNVQRGIRSRFYNHGRYSVTREQGTHQFHCLIAEFMKP